MLRLSPRKQLELMSDSTLIKTADGTDSDAAYRVTEGEQSCICGRESDSAAQSRNLLAGAKRPRRVFQEQKTFLQIRLNNQQVWYAPIFPKAVWSLPDNV